jgi:hypothetical protein
MRGPRTRHRARGRLVFEERPSRQMLFPGSCQGHELSDRSLTVWQRRSLHLAKTHPIAAALLDRSRLAIPIQGGCITNRRVDSTPTAQH